MANTDASSPAVYWHRELPPLAAEFVSEHIIETTSKHVPGTIAHRDEVWEGCYADLMEQTRGRLLSEIARLGGRYAHVLEEAVDTRRNDAAGETWLQGRFRYALLR